MYQNSLEMSSKCCSPDSTTTGSDLKPGMGVALRGLSGDYDECQNLKTINLVHRLTLELTELILCSGPFQRLLRIISEIS